MENYVGAVKQVVARYPAHTLYGFQPRLGERIPAPYHYQHPAARRHQSISGPRRSHMVDPDIGVIQRIEPPDGEAFFRYKYPPLRRTKIQPVSVRAERRVVRAMQLEVSTPSWPMFLLMT